MVGTENEIVIERPVAAVWPYVGRPAQWHTWRGAMKGPVEKVDQVEAIKIGDDYRYESEFLGRQIETVLEVAEYEPDECIGLIMRSGPIAGELVFRCQAIEGGTRVVQESSIDASGFFDIAEPLLKPLLHRQFQNDLKALKELVEGTVSPE